jgi:hypothetical protein
MVRHARSRPAAVELRAGRFAGLVELADDAEADGIAQRMARTGRLEVLRLGMVPLKPTGAVLYPSGSMVA